MEQKPLTGPDWSHICLHYRAFYSISSYTCTRTYWICWDFSCQTKLSVNGGQRATRHIRMTWSQRYFKPTPIAFSSTISWSSQPFCVGKFSCWCDSCLGFPVKRADVHHQTVDVRLTGYSAVISQYHIILTYQLKTHNPITKSWMRLQFSAGTVSFYAKSWTVK